MSAPSDERSDLIVHEFRDTWNDYYAWEQDYCTKQISRLAASAPAQTSHTLTFDDLIAPSPSSSSAENAFVSNNHTNSDGAAFIRHIFDGPSPRSSLVRATLVKASQPLPQPYPPYESCTPLPANVLVEDDPDYLPYLPLPDDPAFPTDDYVEDHEGFAWEEEYRGPDVRAVVLETARRLKAKHGMSPQEMDETGILPLELRTRSSWGAIWTEKMKYVPYFTYQDTARPAANDTRTRLQDYMTLWCPNPDCLTAYCFTHRLDEVVLDPREPLYVNSAPFHPLTPESPCSRNCTWHRPIQDVSEVRFADPSVPQPNVAVLCRQHVRTSAPQPDVRQPTPKFCNELPPNFIPNRPCRHPGPCVDCECARNQAHCSRTCACARTCVRRWPGCKCARSNAGGNRKGKGKRQTKKDPKAACPSDLCPCRLAKRECDSAVCGPCGTACRNGQIQRGACKAVEAKTSALGIGLFLAEDAEKGDLVLEYVGELICEPTFDTRHIVALARGRSYVFGVNEQVSIDSTYAGNPARFINHASAGKANVRPSIMLVYGNQRVGLYAKRKLKAGVELLMDYGPEFPIPDQRNKYREAGI
ncbi:SET domain-containing protein [Epithele typhae]|uniref:SET domain-containing protein n=1 Tax=Epithele typhae TaxID=378194 RepID=UPI0020083091|nr:SET domain-containing protein [Epithele typhae]KAH9940135.1 SET domain-containing protein [Epithele typhae]